MTTTKVHLISGLIISGFVGLHLSNHLMSLVSVEHHIETMNVLRLFYRHVLVETILLLAVLVQIISGLILFRKMRKSVTSTFERLHIWSGLYLAIFLIIHVGAVLGGRFLFQLDTNFYFGVAGLNTFPFSLFFIPYYSLAVFSFFGHIAAIHHKKMKRTLLGVTSAWQAKTVVLIGLIVMLLLLYGLTNRFSGVSIPEAYGVLIGDW